MDAVRVAETHSAVVLLAGDRAYKWKKAVDLGFLDFRDLEQRTEACRRELALNRRLAPDVYLGVGTLNDEDGTPLEPVLMMRRLPDDRRLSALVEEGTSVDTCLRDVARAVASLHARTASPEAGEFATAAVLRGNWQDNFGVLRGAAAIVAPEDVESGARLALGYLDGREPLFAHRLQLACDGHGDLLADDIFCLDDGPRIIDCLDFADRYRLGDPLLDAAFLAMDLERLGRRDLADRFLDWYAEFSGSAAPVTLAHHFVAYRAHVRAKVAVLRARQGDPDAPGAARRLHALCMRHLVAGQVPLVLVGGLPGTGKSTVAAALADRFGWTLLASDALRKDQLGLDRTASAPAAAYTGEARTAVYRTLLDRARALLSNGEPVVADASWLEPEWRESAATLARTCSSPMVAIRCVAPLGTAHQRISDRAARGGTASDATPSVLDQLARDAAPWPAAHVLDTRDDPDAVGTRAGELVTQLLGAAATAS